MIDFSKIKLLVCDFDGVFTDNKVIIDEHGRESVVCSKADEYGIQMLKESGVEVYVISNEENSVVAKRCQKLKIHYRQNVKSKELQLAGIMRLGGYDRDEVIYIGNDINDIECMILVQGIAVADAYEKVKLVAKYVTENKGGNGAVREIADFIINEVSKKGKEYNES